jgi:ankyrin repeat protein
VRSLLQRRPALLHLLDRAGRHAVHYCAENQQTLCIEQLMAAATAGGESSLLNRRDGMDGHTVLHLAVIAGNIAMVKFLLGVGGGGVDIDQVDNEGHSAIHWAVVCGQPTILALLLAAGAAAGRPDGHGAYPIHYAVQACAPTLEPSATR